MSIAEKLTAIAENEQKVYEAGFKAGQAGSGDSHYDAFWDSCQDYGKRNMYRNGFSGLSWNDDTFRPKYDITPDRYQCTSMFSQCGITNLKQCLLDCGVKIDFSTVLSAINLFSDALYITHIPTLDMSACTNLTGVFTNCSSLISIDELKVNENATFSNTFGNCTSLVEIRFAGTIGQSGLNFQHSTNLSKISIESIVEALSATASGQTITLSKTAVEAAFTTDEWNALAATKANWTITLT